MNLLFLEALKLALRFGAEALKTLTPDEIDKAIDVIIPFFIEMLTDAKDKGLGELSADFRTPYEARILRVLRELGLVKTV